MFIAASKSYTSEKELLHQKDGVYQSVWYKDERPLYRDIYGRQVLHVCERFPCFDSYDYLYENRYFHWYFIKTEDQITAVYTEDERSGVSVCNDIRTDNTRACSICKTHFDELKAAGFM